MMFLQSRFSVTMIQRADIKTSGNSIVSNYSINSLNEVFYCDRPASLTTLIMLINLVPMQNSYTTHAIHCHSYTIDSDVYTSPDQFVMASDAQQRLGLWSRECAVVCRASQPPTAGLAISDPEHEQTIQTRRMRRIICFIVNIFNTLHVNLNGFTFVHLPTCF